MASFSTNGKDILETKIEIRESNSNKKDFECALKLLNCVHWIKKNSYERVCLQFSDDMLHCVYEVSVYFKENTDSSIYVLADTSYSSCCVDATAAAHVNADCLIHFGPSCLSPNLTLPVYYVFDNAILNLSSCIKAIKALPDSKTVIFYDAKYHHQIDDIKRSFASETNIDICEIAEDHVIKDDNHDQLFGRIVPKILNHERAIYFGSESMLLTNLTLVFPNLTWFLYEDEHLTEFPFNTSKFLMKRLHLMEKLKDAAVVGVLVGTLSVDGCLQAVDRIKKLCKLSGKKCYTLAVGRPNVAKLANLPEIEVFVLVACPENRLFIEFGDFYQPILSMVEVELALGSKPWTTEYTLDFRQLQQGGRLACKYDADVQVSSSDFSLITGKTRFTGNPCSDETTQNSALTLRGKGTIVESHAAAFLSQRSWGGLEQKLGETPVEDAVQGRRGLPINYENENNHS